MLHYHQIGCLLPPSVVVVVQPEEDTYTIKFEDDGVVEADIKRKKIFAMWSDPPPAPVAK